MRSLIATIVFLIFLIQTGSAQEKQIFIPKNALDSNTDLGKFCDLLSKQENLDRKKIYNLASNGVIARSIQDNNLKYTQVLYNHMLLKLFSDAYFNCEQFSTNYYYVFDADNTENTELVAQHKQFLSKLILYVKKDKFLSKLADPGMATIAYVEHTSEKEYTLSFYNYLPKNGPGVPNEINNRIVKYDFKIDGENIELIEKDIKEDLLKKINS